VSDEHPNAAAYRRVADAFRAGDLATIERLVDNDVVWHVPGHSSRAGEIVGRAALMDFLAGLAGTGFRLREHDVLGNDEHVCALSVMGTRRADLDVETRVVSVFHFRDGRQVERWFFPEDDAVWDLILDDPPRMGE
jgi:ketosteroid isomerase-like protein